MADPRIESLSKVPLFAMLSERELREILRGSTEDRYDQGTVVLREGGHGETLFVIVEGTAKVVRNGRTIARRSEGEFFGEVSVIDGRPRTAAVIAETPLRCIVLYRTELRKIVMGEPEAAWAMLQSLASRIREK